MKKDRRSFLKKSIVGAGVLEASNFPHMWIKNSSLAYAVEGAIDSLTDNLVHKH